MIQKVLSKLRLLPQLAAEPHFWVVNLLLMESSRRFPIMQSDDFFTPEANPLLIAQELV
jgi:hypothetical protein